MPFYQNPFTADFIGVWLLADRQRNPDFKVPRNSGRGDEIVTAFNKGPYDLTGVDGDGNQKSNLTIVFTITSNPKGWFPIEIPLHGSNMSEVTVEEIIQSLNENDMFVSYFHARSDNFDDTHRRLVIRQNNDYTRFRFYIANTGAETMLRFNKYAGVGEIPTYFDRHTIENRFNYEDGQNMLIKLSPTSNVDKNIIDSAIDAKGNKINVSSVNPKPDWELLSGRSGLFTFQKHDFDESGRITTTIEYPAGASAGDLAKKIVYGYNGDISSPATVAEIPYVLQLEDLITPDD